MKITDEVYAVGGGRTGFGISDKYDCNVFLIDGGDELALIDAGCGYDVEPILNNICLDGFAPGDIRRLLLTHAHADHSGGAATLRERLNLEVASSDQEAKFLEEGDETAVSLDRARDEGIYPADFHLEPCAVDRRLAHGDEVRCGHLTMREPSAVAARTIRTHQSRFPVVVAFDRGDGGEPAQIALLTGTYKIATDPETGLWDLFFMPPAEGAPTETSR